MPLRSVFNFFLLLALLSFAVLGCSTSEESTKPVASQARVPKEQFFDYQLTETSAGIKQWVLISDEMRKYSDQEDVELTTVMMDFFRDGTHFSVLTADSGKAHLLTKDVYTWGNVVVITDDGRRLECEELYFSNETQLIHNEVFNTFTRGNDVMTGIGLEATPDLDYIEIKRQVEAEVIDQANGSAADPKADSRTESDLH
jgi:LPS export ABC transporter protein LptC